MSGIPGRLNGYLDALTRLSAEIVATDAAGREIPVEDAIDETLDELDAVKKRGGKIMFVGNGGSAAIASHMAIDFCKNGGVPALAFNDAATLTCLANDLGYAEVFARQIKALGKAGDLLVAISSSGRSPNILKAVAAAKDKKVGVLTLSGFAPDNPLRRLGRINLYAPSGEYGFVEITHMALCHAILDLAMGWAPEKSR